jgi:predicted transposase YbfD/YdcC
LVKADIEGYKLSFLELLSDVPDPRMAGKVKHNLGAIIFVTLCGVMSSCTTWPDIHEYCKHKHAMLSRYVDLSNGSPSAWTFRRVFTLLDPKFLELLLRSFAANAISGSKRSDQIAIDGKSLRGSQRQGLQSLKSVSAWCHENGLVLAEQEVDANSNEITAIPFLLEALDLRGNTVTIDAAGCQKSIVQQIRDKKGHYVLGLKGNQKKLLAAVTDHIAQLDYPAKNKLHDSFDERHGRCVRRRYFGFNISKLPEIEGWAGARSVIAVETIHSKHNDPKHKVTATWRYYLSSHKHNDPKLPDYVRNHWGIENKLHWVLDVYMKEDDDLKAERRSARCFALLRRIALNVVRSKNPDPKKSVRLKLLYANWDEEHMIELLS